LAASVAAERSAADRRGAVTPSLRSLRAPMAIAAIVVVADQLTKHWALNALGPSAEHPSGRNIDLFWTLRFNLAFNTGMAFSSGEGIGPLVPILAIGVIAVLLISIGKSSSRWYSLAVGLVIGGALGNIIDRLFRGEGGLHGAVVDFIDLQWWPIFNVADIAVVVGGALLLLTTLRSS
jgi:signal peptidase II